MSKKKKQTKNPDHPEPVYQLWAWVLLIWSLYRYFIHVPEWADELVFKPLVFVAPVLWYVITKEKKSLATIGLTKEKLFPSLYLGLGFGFIFALEGFVANVMKYGQLQFHPSSAYTEYGLLLLLVLSVATAFSEELLCRGFLFTRILELKKHLVIAASFSALMFLLLHVPILVTTTKLAGVTLIIFMFTDLILGFANAMLFYNTNSLVAPVLVHVFWNMTVSMYL